ncbi:hypothetical protein LO80_08065 [Candidatus Francisella endociliophora]|uniref:DUF4124 domain-containing protein n=1 Tax=Candidatus Francisella endociliophora TaxID=653937 RepID=A0A097EQT8_9GAMM|nr:hypothetical protein [Francisella sp. FSC1006]AIT09926.1 hypothetical protein LO80_08065 [Francisella sp. FSC1006]
MKYFKNITILTLITMFSSFCYADESDNVYTWRSGNGTVVFSQSTPMFDEEYERIGVHHNNQVHQKSPVEQQLASLKQNNIYIPDNSQSENQPNQQQEVNRGIQRVEIISPAPGENRFIHNEKLTIILRPALTAEDHPIFIMNGIPHPAHFENGVWKVNRPNPGPVSITVRGRTHDHKTIVSNESEFNRRQVLGR